jgi:two-component system OmpR family sensor kinase
VFRTLYGRLVAVLGGIFLLVAILTLVLTFFTTRLYLAEVNQKLNRTLAGHLVSEEALLKDGKVNPGALKDVFHMLMVINPGIEVYLLDPRGKILAYSAPPGKVKRSRVSLIPVRAFLSGTSALPILGDDPRGPESRKVFSAAPIEVNHRVQGYMYVILGGEEYDTAIRILAGSYILKLGLWTAGASLLFAFAVGIVVFRALTKRLERLATEVDDFQKSDFSGEIGIPGREKGASGDEIDRLRTTFARMATRIQEQVRRLVDTDRQRRDMVANVSHDFRTPLTALQGYIDTLLLKGDALDPEERDRYLEIAARQGRRLSSLVEELFELAKLDALETAPHPEPFSLGELVSDVASKYRLKAEENGLQIATDVPEGLPPVFADIGMVERVLENLIGNALWHTPQGGLVLLALQKKNGRIRVRVRDTGRGIPPEELNNIFLRFYRVDTDRSPESGGTGLGLAIVKRILELHRSRIDVESALGKGTTFSFDLPVLTS